MPTHLWLFGLLRMVDICFYFECKGNVFWEGMQSSFWFIFVLWGGGFYAHPFFSRWGRLLLPGTRVAPPDKSGTSRLRAWWRRRGLRTRLFRRGIHKKSVNSLDVVPATEALALPFTIETTTRSPRRYNKRG